MGLIQRFHDILDRERHAAADAKLRELWPGNHRTMSELAAATGLTESDVIARAQVLHLPGWEKLAVPPPRQSRSLFWPWDVHGGA
jgi:hypothetical protein